MSTTFIFLMASAPKSSYAIISDETILLEINAAAPPMAPKYTALFFTLGF